MKQFFSYILNKIEYGKPISHGMDTYEMKQYFEKRYNERFEMNKNLLEKYNLYGKTLLDICSGFGQDSVFFAKHGNMIVDSIEKDWKATAIHQDFIEKYDVIDKNKIFCCDMFKFVPIEEYDVVYTSSPSNWMHGNPDKVIPDKWLNFLKLVLKPDGFFIARLYGGNYTSLVIRSDTFIKLLKERLESIDFSLLDYQPEKFASTIFVARRNKK